MVMVDLLSRYQIWYRNCCQLHHNEHVLHGGKTILYISSVCFHRLKFVNFSIKPLATQ